MIGFPLTYPQINNARSKADEGKNKLDNLRKDAQDKISSGVDQARSGVDQVDHTVEQKAAEAKGTLSGWLGGKK